MNLHWRCSAFVCALLWSRYKAEQGITSARVLGKQRACGLTHCMLNVPSSMLGRTAGVSYCFRKGQDAASSIPLGPCLVVRKYLQEENTCAIGLRRFIHLSSLPRREPSHFLRCPEGPPFFQTALLCRAVQEGMPPRRLQMQLAVRQPDQSLLTGSGENRAGLHCWGV